MIKITDLEDRELLLRKLAIEIVDRFLDMGLFQTCCNCSEWKPKEEICCKFNIRPPAKVICTGCEYHTDNIPF
jgi:hypothetical protein